MEDVKTFDVIVIGWGKAGKTLAGYLNGANIKCAVVEKDPAMYGGSCINVACIPTKTMVTSAKIADFAFKHAKENGINLDKIEVNFKGILNRKKNVVESLREINYKQLKSLPNCEIILGDASFVSSTQLEVKAADGKVHKIRSGKIFVNTGSLPFDPSIPGLKECSNVYNSTTAMEQLQEIPEHLIVLGGGYIGLEFGQMFRRFGAKVTLVEQNATFLPHEDRDIADTVAQIFKDDGIDILTASKALKAEQHDGKISITVKKGEEEVKVVGSHVLVATGRSPNTQTLNLASAGVKTDERGYIIVNDKLETSAPGIWALGDVNGGPQFTYISLDDFRIVKANVFDKGNRSTKDREYVPITVFMDPPLSRVGLTETEAVKKGHSIKISTLKCVGIPKARLAGETKGMLKVVIDASNNQVLGATFLSAESHEFITTVQFAMMAKMPYTVLRDAIYPHPSMVEALNIMLGNVVPVSKA